MNKPQRKSSFGKRESLHSVYRSSSGFGTSKNTPLLKSTTRIPLSAAKTNQRESYIGTSHQHAVKDSRPLQDKSYMKRCIVEIIQILSSLNYPNTLTPKMFNPPSTKDYQRVFEFLTSEIMGTFRIIGKPDEEMLRALKDLGYPYNISKSTLSNVGAMSCWPHALGALMWIADLSRYCQGVGDAIDQSLFMDTRKKIKQEFNSRCYVEFMNGEDGPFTELVDQLKETVAELDESTVKSLAKLKAESAKLSAEYDAKKQEKENCLNLIEEVETKRSNIQKMSHYLTQCDEYVAVMINKKKEMEDSIRAKEEEIKESNEKFIQIKSRVSQQDLGPADIEKLVREKQQLREAINIGADRLEQLKTMKWDLDVQIGKLALKADELADSFNNSFKTVFNSLSLIKDHLPVKLIDDVQLSHFTLALGHKGLENEEILTGKIQPFQTSLNNTMLKVVGNLEAEHYNVQKRVKQVGEIVDDLTKEKEQLAEQYQKLVKESKLQQEHRKSNSAKTSLDTSRSPATSANFSAVQECKSAEEAIIDKLNKAQTSLEQLKSVHSESVEDLEIKLQETKERKKLDLEKFAQKEASAEESLEKLSSSVKQFQTTLHERVKELHEAIANIDQEGIKRLSASKVRAAEIENNLPDLDKCLEELEQCENSCN